MQTKFVQHMDKMLWLSECGKSGLRSFVLEICLWMMLRGQVDQLKLTVIKLRPYWRRINVI